MQILLFHQLLRRHPKLLRKRHPYSHCHRPPQQRQMLGEQLANRFLLHRRRAEWKPTAPIYERSFAALYQRHVSQANEGCDFDFLTGTQAVPEPPIY